MPLRIVGVCKLFFDSSALLSEDFLAREESRARNIGGKVGSEKGSSCNDEVLSAMRVGGYGEEGEAPGVLRRTNEDMGVSAVERSVEEP